MTEAVQTPRERRQNRGFILGSLSLGHGISHLYDQGFSVFLTAIAQSLGLTNFQVAALLGIRQGGFGRGQPGGRRVRRPGQEQLGADTHVLHALVGARLRCHWRFPQSGDIDRSGVHGIYPRGAVAPSGDRGPFPAIPRPPRFRHFHTRFRFEHRERAGAPFGGRSAQLSSLAPRSLPLRHSGSAHDRIRLVVPPRTWK